MAVAGRSVGISASGATRLVVLLGLMLFISYVDRGNLATVAPLIKDELHISSTQLGVLFSAFYWSYTLCQFPAGWLAERFGAKSLLMMGAAIWSISTLMTGFVNGLYALLALRVLLGIGESAAFPCTNKLLAAHVDPFQRGRANGMTTFGQALGPAVGTWIGGLIAASAGWRSLFVLIGCASLLWLMPWWQTRLPAVRVVHHDSAASISTRRILRERALWGTAIGLFSANYGLYFTSSWLPTYLVKARGLSVAQMAQTASAIYVVWALSALTMGWLFDRLIRAGASRTRVSKALLATACIGKIGCIGVVVFAPPAMAIPFLFINESFSGLVSSVVWQMSQTIAGPHAIGRWIGVQLTFGNVAGIIAPLITGMTIDFTGRFAAGFGLVALAYIVGAIAWLFIVEEVEPLDWSAALQSAGQAQPLP